ncbi:MAG: CDP-alcohol phosphatidyltransferase family protein [Gemmatimonadota bacterium]
MTVPDALTWFRVVTSPALPVLAWTLGTGWVVGFLLVLQITDWVDGPLARGLRQHTTVGARLDSLADVLMFGSLLAALAVLEGRLLWDAWPWIAVAVGSYTASSAYALARFGRMPTYHQWTAKVSGPITLVAALAVFLLGEGWPVRVAAAAVTLGNVEGALITSRLEEPRTDIPSVFALDGRDGGDA